MKLFDQNKVAELGQTLNNTSDKMYRNLNEIDRLLELLPESFYDINSKKVCDKIKNNDLIILREYCGRLLNMQNFLDKFSVAYTSLDNDTK